MAELVARGPEEQDGWKRTLPQGSVTLGRLAEKSDWAVPWDLEISRIHATLSWDGSRLHVRRAWASQNPIIYRNHSQDTFAVEVGDSFTIGKTTFTLLNGDAPPGPQHLSILDLELTYTSEELRQVRYADADDRVGVLAELPHVIRLSLSDEELERRVLDVLLRGIPRAGAALVLRLKAPQAAGEPEVRTRAARAPELSRVPPSRRLVAAALGPRRSVVHVKQDPKKFGPAFTVAPEFDWALCAPLPDEPERGWGLYVAGRLQSPAMLAADPRVQEMLKSDLKFAEAVAAIFGALRQVRELQAEQLHVRASLQVAREIQAGFFPRALPCVPGYELVACSRSTDETGGDYYDVLPLGPTRFGLVVADVCGHGLGPSLLMASVRSVFRGIAFRDPAPEALVDDLNQALYDDLRPQRRFVTLLYGTLDAAAHRFHYANAGHGPMALHVRPARGQVQSLVDDARGCPLGILREPYRACAPVALESGDLLVLGSDGVVETRRGGEQFGVARAADFLLRRANRPLQQTLDELVEAVAEHHERGRPDDDLTLMIARRR